MIKPIAIYLPQFHPVPENDVWWEKGFTEWTNVTKAKPLFKGHYQPQLPTDLGFYDLRLPEVRQAQADLAKRYGIYGFCYYHYWFNGKRILERPFQEVFESGKPDFPFMLCWANENWTKAWDGSHNHILLEQRHSPEDDLEHIRTLIPYMKDSRYIRIHNKPIIAIYRSTIIPDIENTLKIWRKEAAGQGLELYICRFETFGKRGKEFLQAGFDAAIEFQPFSSIDLIKAHYALKPYDNLIKRIQAKINKLYLSTFQELKYKDVIINYDDLVNINQIKKSAADDYKLFPCCMPGWDNTSRRKEKRTIIANSTPEKFGNWFKHHVDYVSHNFEEEEQLIFINAWNEWAEGNHLEPCRKWGSAYLEQIKSALK